MLPRNALTLVSPASRSGVPSPAREPIPPAPVMNSGPWISPTECNLEANALMFPPSTTSSCNASTSTVCGVSQFSSVNVRVSVPSACETAPNAWLDTLTWTSGGKATSEVGVGLGSTLTVTALSGTLVRTTW